ncbi:MAG TPA: MBL fold metallo-hydrolase [Vicinamibacterales bacterium]|nr:MBL fold metallo-hydrolase [Vicinamibacterales bacterium]
MLLRTLTPAGILVGILSTSLAGQNAGAVVAAASKAMGVDTLHSITFSGTARNGAFGQSKAIGEPMGTVNLTRVTQYTRTINFGKAADPTALVSRATGPTQPPTVPGAPQPAPGVLNQNVTGAQAASSWNQALTIWTTPWGFLKGAAASNATARQEGNQQIVSFSPAGLTSPSGQAYTVTGYIDGQHRVTKVQTRVEHAVVGDLLVEFEYSAYQTMSGVQVPTRIVQRQAGLQTFDATITSATPNPAHLAELLTPAPPAAGPGGAPAATPAAPQGRGGSGAPAAPPPAGAPPVERIGDGVFRIGGNYTSLAIDMGDHILVVESGQNDARGMAVMAAAKEAIPNKPVRYVVNSHPHFDHAGGLAAAVAEGATILTHRNNEQVLERLLSGPRTLIGDSLSKVTSRRTNVVEAVGDRDVRKGTNGKIVELHHVPNEHSDGMFAVYLPAEKVVWTADINIINPNPVQQTVVRAAVDVLNRLKLDDYTWLPTHPPNPDRPLTKADVMAAAAGKSSN